MGEKVEVYLEIGQKRTFAAALAWPGWSRSGRDETAALQALLDYGPRYERAIRSARTGFNAPADLAAFVVTERLPGGSGTDFGAPGAIPSSDAAPVGDDELRRLKALLQACWRTLDEVAAAAAGKELRRGPRGGGRDLTAILSHVREAERAYLGRIGGEVSGNGGQDEAAGDAALRQAAMEGLEAMARGEVPTQGPRGGLRWPARYFVRRAAWHVLDHAWEIEDRLG
jgi:hypothetical protein